MDVGARRLIVVGAIVALVGVASVGWYLRTSETEREVAPDEASEPPQRATETDLDAARRREKLSADLERARSDAEDARRQNEGLAASLDRERRGPGDATDPGAAPDAEAPAPVAPPEPAKLLRGVVQAASAKDDVYVISLGSMDGLATGDRLRVTRNGVTVATLIASKIFPNHAGCTAEPPNAPIRAGDRVERVAK